MLGSVIEQDLVERGNHRHYAFGSVCLHARDGDLASGEVDVGAVELAQLGDSEAGQRQGCDQSNSGDVVASALWLVDPHVPAADLADERVGHFVLAREPRGRLG